MRRIVIVVCLLLCTAVWFSPRLSGCLATAQNNDETASDCLRPNFLLGSQVRVVGSVEAAGLPVREQKGLEYEVIGFIPINTILIPQSYDGCEDGRNWFSVEDVSVNDELISGYVLADDGYHYWLEASQICPNNGAWLRFWDYYNNVVELYPGTKTLTFAMTENFTTENDLRHPVLLNHYEIDIPSGALRPTTYPYADIVTRDLTDRLGITEFVFGERSNNRFSLHVSPDRKKILYFVPSKKLKDCTHSCYLVEGFVADADGSNPRSLGEIPTDASITRIYWGTDGRIYLTHITEEAPRFFTVGICIEDGCTLEGNIADIAAKYGVNVPSGSIVTTSPNGQYLAITPLYRNENLVGWDGSAYIIDTQNSGVITLPDSGLSGVPIFWDNDGQILYGVDMNGVVDESDYADAVWLLETDRWLIIRLDFTQETYDIDQDTLDMSNDNNDIFGDVWYGSWVKLSDLNMFLPVPSGLKCVSGGRG